MTMHSLVSASKRSLAGKTALVTGATGGIGGAIALELARRGAQLVISGRDKGRLEALRQKLDNEQQAAEHPAVSIECDIRDAPGIRALAASASARSGGKGIDILVNAAGISRDGLLLRLKESDLADTLQTNLVGAMMLSKELALQMVRQRTGVIINVSSVIGLHGNAGQSAYAASKAGLIGFTKALAKELGPRGVRVNAVAPGFISTELTREILEQPAAKELISKAPLAYAGAVEDVAHGAAYLAEARYVTGQAGISQFVCRHLLAWYPNPWTNRVLPWSICTH